MFAYRVGFPGWKIAARLGFPLIIHANVIWDDEAKVFVACSDDFLPHFGCVTEGATFEELQRKVRECCEMALEEIFQTTNINQSIRTRMILLNSFEE